MRKIGNKERIQRGCDRCADSISPSEDVTHKRTHRRCPYKACPYTELDGFDRYKDYVRSIGSDNVSTLVKELNLGTL